jgi:hypothetical protein
VWISVLSPYVPHIPPITSSLLWSPEEYFVRRTGDEAPHYAIFSSFPLLSSSSANLWKPFIHIVTYVDIRDIQRLGTRMEQVMLSKLPVQRFRNEEWISVYGVTFSPSDLSANVYDPSGWRLKVTFKTVLLSWRNVLGLPLCFYVWRLTTVAKLSSYSFHCQSVTCQSKGLAWIVLVKFAFH